MAALNAWQKITRVVGGKPFGNGSDGAYASATIPTIVYEAIASASADQTSITAAGTTLSDNDLLLIIQMRGTGVGQWEINKVASGGGTTSIVLSKDLHYAYTDSGNSEAQAVVIPQYTNVTVQSGTWSLTDWDKNEGGIFVLACSGTLTIEGAISGVGEGGGAGSPDDPNHGGTGIGYHGGASFADNGVTGYAGEGSTGDEVIQTSANGNGGGGGNTPAGGGRAGGGGGGNGTAGQNGETGIYEGTGGTGGTVDGSADLLDFVIGGAGGGGTIGDASPNNYAGAGGCGGGGIFIFAKTIADMDTAGGTIALTGGAGGGGGGANANEGGGGGAGGSMIVQCKDADFGTGNVSAAGGSGLYNGGDGGVGRFAVHHSGTVEGTTSPTFDNTEDLTLIESGGFLGIL